MSSAVTSIPTRPAEGDVHELMQEMGRAAVSAAERLALASSAAKDRALSAAATAVRAQAGAILAANAEDLREGRAGAAGPPRGGLFPAAQARGPARAPARGPWGRDARSAAAR